MFTTSEIAKAICHSRDKNEQLRLQALLLVKNGLSPAKVAKDFSVHRSTVHRWMKRAEEEGLYNLKCKPGRGVKSFLSTEQLSELKKALSKPIQTEDGFSRGWQTKDAIQFVREKFGISYSESRMRQIIKNLGLSKIVCRPQSKRRNQALTNEFIAEIKKKLLNPNHLFVTQDESGFCVDSNRSKCWAIKGSKPIKFTSGSKARINIGGFYTENGDFYWYDLGVKQNTESYLKSLLSFKRDIGRKIFLRIDRATWHRSKKTKEFYQNNKQWLQTMFFPSATPDRNPTEYCWKITREDLTSIKSFKNTKILKEELHEYWDKHTFTHKMSHYLKW
ncbi:hypothetical protein DU74_09240 [Methanosarcina mazei]|uniref:IS630 family transposase n=2 Tax=Methanosarcina mazei TaxID=2209 RepID=A0A0F8JBP3_METMZ|nr:hypothetical protein DU67_09650 [Methanosarcina mazei]KKH57613.1 hypothetical protein DU74_09240 [Methanosarcina mazei]